jgi:hypothetical protein
MRSLQSLLEFLESEERSSLPLSACCTRSIGKYAELRFVHVTEEVKREAVWNVNQACQVVS